VGNFLVFIVGILRAMQTAQEVWGGRLIYGNNSRLWTLETHRQTKESSSLGIRQDASEGRGSPRSIARFASLKACHAWKSGKRVRGEVQSGFEEGEKNENARGVKAHGGAQSNFQLALIALKAETIGEAGDEKRQIGLHDLCA